MPTPIQPWSFTALGNEVNNLYIKRDDLTDCTASGNKLRKLEFILPDVIRDGYDWVVTVGGTQSNHCRAVAAVCARLGIKCAVVLRKDFYYDETKPNEGNLFFHKLFGTRVFLVSKAEYSQKGSLQLIREAGEKLKTEFGAVNPYLLPVGGSILNGVYGYIECIHEIELQLAETNLEIDEIIFACGSGGTATGLAIGKYLSTSPFIKRAKLVGFLACDTPEYFHEHVNEMLQEMGLSNEVKSEDIIRFVQAKGIGYAMNTEEELEVIKQVASSSGIILDASYTGKAITEWLKQEKREEVKTLFIHTGGMFSLFGHTELFK